MSERGPRGSEGFRDSPEYGGSGSGGSHRHFSQDEVDRLAEQMFATSLGLPPMNCSLCSGLIDEALERIQSRRSHN